jgi:hypothetical protein
VACLAHTENTMSPINGISINHVALPISSDPLVSIAGQPSPQADSQPVAPTAPNASVKVALSVEGLRASASASAPSASTSTAAAQAKEMAQIRERIKELQQQIQEKQTELQAAQADRNLSAEQKSQRVSAASQQLASLNAALATATTQLLTAMKGKPELGGADSVQPIPYVKASGPQASSSQTT